MTSPPTTHRKLTVPVGAPVVRARKATSCPTFFVSPCRFASSLPVVSASTLMGESSAIAAAVMPQGAEYAAGVHTAAQAHATTTAAENFLSIMALLLRDGVRPVPSART